MKYLMSYYKKQFLSILQMSTMLGDIYEDVKTAKYVKNICSHLVVPYF